MNDLSLALGSVMLMSLHLAAAAPVLALLFWFRRRSHNAHLLPYRLLAAVLAALFLAPALVPSHFPLLLPFAVAFLLATHLGVLFSLWNLLTAVSIGAVVFIFWPMRSNPSMQRTTVSGRR
jgi:hypothetical protein